MCPHKNQEIRFPVQKYREIGFWQNNLIREVALLSSFHLLNTLSGECVAFKTPFLFNNNIYKLRNDEKKKTIFSSSNLTLYI